MHAGDQTGVRHRGAVLRRDVVFRPIDNRPDFLL
jgi:hypothetical protein